MNIAPCPFCGLTPLPDEVEYEYNGPGPPPSCNVRCPFCGAQGPFGYGNHRGDNKGAKTEALTRWNERKP